MDPMKNNNTAVIRRIAKRALTANRTRNIFAVCAIILTTFMLSAVFSIGSSLIHNMNIMEIRSTGTTASIFLKNPTDAQYNKIRTQSKIEAVGLQINIGSVTEKTPDGKDTKIAIGYFDPVEWETHYTPAISDIQGDYPSSRDEIILSRTALKQLGITGPEIGQSITLDYRTKKEKKSQTFRLSGWYTDYNLSQTGVALLSWEYCKQEGISTEKAGRLSISCAPANRDACLEQLETNIPLEKGQKFDYTWISQGMAASDMITIAITLAGVALLIVLSGYLLIYNVVYISVTKDARFYGMLKTIGASPKQIKRLVHSQIFRLAAVGIPVGLLLGLAVSFGIVPYALNLFGTGGVKEIMPREVSFNLWIFLATALFSLLTIIISCRKPAKIAGNISPVEALKYTGVSSGGKQKDHHSKRGGKLWRMAFHNIFRDRRRSFLVFASLFMGTITFLCVNSILGSISVENYLKAYVPNPFTISSQPPIVEKFDKDYLRALSKIDGVTDMKTSSTGYCDLEFDEKNLEPLFRATYKSSNQETSFEAMLANMKAAADSGHFGVWIKGISEDYVKEYNKTHTGKIDLDAFRQGKICILGYDDETSYRGMVGRSLTLSPKGSGEKHSIKVGGSFSRDDCNLKTSETKLLGLMDTVFVSDAFMQTISSNPIVDEILLDCDPDAEPYVKQQIKTLNNTLVDQSFEFTARSDKAAEFESTTTTMKVLGGGISFLLISVGLLNFINVMLTSVYARRQELAVMESVGMTKRQVKRMLTWEGGFYALITALIILTLGNVLLYWISQSVTSIADYAVFRYPYGKLLILTGIMSLICLTVPRIVFRTTAKETVTERLHQIDS